MVSQSTGVTTGPFQADSPGMRLVLFQPEIAANVGAAIRVCACFGAGLDVIEPCGFTLKHKDIRRVGLDYGALAPPVTWPSWSAYAAEPGHSGRLVLLTTRAQTSLHDIAFGPDDRLMLGQESAGVPEAVHAFADLRIRIPVAPAARSLNMAVAGAVGLAEMRRQSGWD